MNVKSFVAELSKFPDSYNVVFSDPFNNLFFDGDYSVEDFDGLVDIGVGGTVEGDNLQYVDKTTVGKLINKLSEFPDNAFVVITDGHNLKFYRGKYHISEFEGVVDVGIGGTLENDF